MPETPPESATEIAVRIRLANLSELPLESVSHHYIHHTADSFFVFLSQIVPPPVLLMSEEERSRLEYVDAKVVAKLIMTPSEFKSFIDAASTNYKLWQETNTPATPAAPRRRSRTR